MNPKVTVLMSVYNGEPFLRQTVESVLRQAYKDFEFIIVNDGSDDATAQILEHFKDPRLRVISVSSRQGLSKSLNSALMLARGEYVARMDADDICRPERLTRQVAYLDDHLDITVVGSACFNIDETGTIRGFVPYFTTDVDIKRSMSLRPREAFIAHPAVMMRKKHILDVGGYCEDFDLTQDKDLWIRLAQKGGRFANLETPLLMRRKVKDSHGDEQIRRETSRVNVYSKHAAYLARVWQDYRFLSLPRVPQVSNDMEAQGYAELYDHLGRGLMNFGQSRLARQAFLVAMKLKQGKQKSFVAWIDASRVSSVRRRRSWEPYLFAARTKRRFFNAVRRFPIRFLAQDRASFILSKYLWILAGLARLHRDRCAMVDMPPLMKRRLNIGLVTNEYVSEGKYCSGLAQYTYRSAQLLKGAGHEVHVITMASDKTPETRSLIHDGIRVHRIFLKKRWRILDRILLKLQLYLTFNRLDFIGSVCGVLRKLHRAHAFDVLQFTNAHAAGLIAGPFLGVPYTVRVSSHRRSWSRLAQKERNLDIRILEWLEWLQIKWSKFAYAPSRKMKEVYASESGLKHLEVIPSPIFIETQTWDESLVDAFPKNREYLLYFGNLKPSKGVHVLAKALREWLPHQAEACVVFIGKEGCPDRRPTMSEELKNTLKLFPARVFIMGAVNHDRLYPLIAHAKLICLPSLIDNLPNTCLEAMALGRPVIGTQGTSFDEAITHNVSGFLVPPGDVSALLAQIDRAWEDPNLDTIGQRAKEVMRDYAPARYLHDLLHHYEKVIGRPVPHAQTQRDPASHIHRRYAEKRQIAFR